MSEEQQAIEISILIALFNAVVEQQSQFYGVYQHKTKAIFNDWINKGYRLQKQINYHAQEDEYVDQMTRVIENAVHEVRKTLTNANKTK